MRNLRNKRSNRNKKTEGNSLVYVIISVFLIILLISILVILFNNKKNLEKEQKIEQEIVNTEEKTINNSDSKLTEEEKRNLLNNGIGEITKNSIINTNLIDTNKIKAVITGEVPIPVDATYIDGNVNTGVVIEYKESEFVWVPVKDVIYDSSKDNMIPKTASTASLTEGHNYTPMAILVNGNYKGLLYDYNIIQGAYLKYSNAMQYQGLESEYREPALLKIFDSDKEGFTKYNQIGLTELSLQQSYNEMVKSVEKYGGFFVGRYETSVNEISGKAQSKSDVRPANASDSETSMWYGLYQKQKEFTDSTDIMQASMIWGSQYDAMLNWVLTGDDKKYVTSSINATHNATFNHTTIRTRSTTEKIDSLAETDRINNIYDLEGNLWEWTQEAVGTDSRTNRGGYFYGNSSPSTRNKDLPYNTYNFGGSRLSLYIK